MLARGITVVYGEGGIKLVYIPSQIWNWLWNSTEFVGLRYDNNVIDVWLNYLPVYAVVTERRIIFFVASSWNDLSEIFQKKLVSVSKLIHIPSIRLNLKVRGLRVKIGC